MATISLVQVNGVAQTTAATGTLTVTQAFATNNTSGNSIVVFAIPSSTSWAPTWVGPICSDTLGNTYSDVYTYYAGFSGIWINIYVANNIHPGANAVQFQVNASGGTTGCLGILIAEYSGVLPTGLSFISANVSIATITPTATVTDQFGTSINDTGTISGNNGLVAVDFAVGNFDFRAVAIVASGVTGVTDSAGQSMVQKFVTAASLPGYVAGKLFFFDGAPYTISGPTPPVIREGNSAWIVAGTGPAGGGTGARATSGGGGGGGGGSGFTASGDLTGTATRQTVIGLEGVPLDASTVATPSNGQVITYDAASGKYKAETPTGGGGGSPPYISPLIPGPDTTHTITGATHGFATAALLVQVYDNASPRNAIEAGWTVNASTYDVVVSFATPQSNYYIVINGGGGGGTGASPLVIGFSMGSGATGTGLVYAVAPRAGSVSKCKAVVTKSDTVTDLTYKIKKNGTDVFSADPTLTHGSSGGTLFTSTSLTSVPLSVAADDIFSIDITAGTSSWVFTAQLET